MDEIIGRHTEVPIHRIRNGETGRVKDSVVIEIEASIVVNGELLIQTTSSPGDLSIWALGYLRAEGWIEDAGDVREIREEDGCVHVDVTGMKPALNLDPITGDRTLGLDQVRDAVCDLADRAVLFPKTGGTHIMGFADGAGIVTSAEDISRTCALERAIGQVMREGRDLSCLMAVLSSRVPRRMIEKLVRCRVPFAAAISAPTAQAVELADRLGLCLVGFVRDDRLNVYTHAWRVGL